MVKWRTKKLHELVGKENSLRYKLGKLPLGSNERKEVLREIISVRLEKAVVRGFTNFVHMFGGEQGPWISEYQNFEKTPLMLSQ